MGASEVVLIGGEAYLHPGFLFIVQALRQSGIVPVLTTGGRGIRAPLARSMASAGLARASVSLDGLAPAHDSIRARPGSFDQACQALDHLGAAGIALGANTTLNQLNSPDLEGLYEVVKSHGVASWQVQLMAPLGRAAEQLAWLLALAPARPRPAHRRPQGARPARGTAHHARQQPGVLWPRRVHLGISTQTHVKAAISLHDP